MLGTFTASTFNEGETFRILFAEENYIDLTLYRIMTGKYPRHGFSREPFSLIFSGTKEIDLGQGSYRIVHERTGEFELFIVPIATPPGFPHGVYYYEAVFG